MIGGSEIFLVLLAVFLLFGADKLPEIAKGLGKGMRDLKKATDDIKDEITKESSINDIVNEVKDIGSTINNDFTKNTHVNIDINNTDTTKPAKQSDHPTKIPLTNESNKTEEDEVYR